MQKMSIPAVPDTLEYGRWRQVGRPMPTRFRDCARIHVIGIGAGDPDYVTAQAVAALNDTAGVLRDGQGRQAQEGRPGGAAATDLRAVHPRARLPVRRTGRPGARQGRHGQCGLPAGGRRLACGAGAGVGRRHRIRTGARRRRRLPGVGRPVALRQHAADPRRRRRRASTSTTTSSPASPRSRR